MAEKSWNKNVRFNRNSESAMQAWSLLHSDEVEKEFKSQNECEIVNTLSSYAFKLPSQIKSVDDEFNGYEEMEKGES